MEAEAVVTRATIAAALLVAVAACATHPAPVELNDAIVCHPPTTTTIATPHNLPAQECRR